MGIDLLIDIIGDGYTPLSIDREQIKRTNQIFFIFAAIFLHSIDFTFPLFSYPADFLHLLYA